MSFLCKRKTFKRENKCVCVCVFLYFYPVIPLLGNDPIEVYVTPMYIWTKVFAINYLSIRLMLPSLLFEFSSIFKNIFFIFINAHFGAFSLISFYFSCSQIISPKYLSTLHSWFVIQWLLWIELCPPKKDMLSPHTRYL